MLLFLDDMHKVHLELFSFLCTEEGGGGYPILQIPFCGGNASINKVILWVSGVSRLAQKSGVSTSSTLGWGGGQLVTLV